LTILRGLFCDRLVMADPRIRESDHILFRIGVTKIVSCELYTSIHRMEVYHAGGASSSLVVPAATDAGLATLVRPAFLFGCV
jgi:hypothetical protein